MANNKEIHNQILRGQFGKVWIDGELYANVKSFEAKISLKYESVDINGEMGVHQRLVGFEGAGTLVLHKIDSRVAQKIAGKIKNGSVPDIKIVSKLTDPDVNGAERIELTSVTLDELTHGFENKKVQEESYPFKFADYNYLDLIL